MKIPVRPFLGVAVALAVAVSPAVLQPVPARASNVFCGADGSYVPWDAARNAPLPSSATDESALRVQIYTATGSTVAALVTLVTGHDAYRAMIAGLPLHAPKTVGDRESDPFVVTFDHPIDVQFAYIDSYAVDGGELGSCPSYVNQVDPFGAAPRPHTALPSFHLLGSTIPPTVPVRHVVVAGSLLEPLPQVTCGAMYKPAVFLRSDWSDQVNFDNNFASFGGFSYQPFAGVSGEQSMVGSPTVIAVAVTSDGKPVAPQVVHSSGDTLNDRDALDIVRGGAFKPAEFLCTPVVSIIFVQRRYQ